MATLAVITGASSGIGEAYALELAKRGEYDLVLAARRVDRLEAVATRIREIYKSRSINRAVTVIPVDLASAISRSSFVNSIKALSLPVGLLINNAGFGSIGYFHQQPKEVEMVEVNCVAAVDLTYQLLPDMLRAGDGKIIFLSSVAAFQPMPYFSTYAATKAFLLSFSVALSREYQGSGVSFSAVCPGPTESEFHLVAGLKRKIDMLPAMTAERVVVESLDKTTASIVVPGFRNKFLTTLGKHLPLPLVTRVVSALLRTYSQERIPT